MQPVLDVRPGTDGTWSVVLTPAIRALRTKHRTGLPSLGAVQTEVGRMLEALAYAAMPEVLRADAISGNHDALLHVATPDVPALQQLLLALQRAGAARVTTMLRLASYKNPSSVPATPQPRAATSPF